MTLRSMLFMPGDSEKKLAKGLVSSADALILDLEDAVAPGRKSVARALTSEFLKSRPARFRPQLWVRINPLSTPLALVDLAAIVASAPDGIVVPKVDGPSDVARLSFYLDALEARESLQLGAVRILAVATETARAPFSLGEYAKTSLPRLKGLTWGAEDLSTALEASTNRAPSGEYAFTYQMARSLCLLGAKAAGVEAIDTMYADFKDAEGLRAQSEAARREGFTGRLAIHPDQVAVINEAFTPSLADVEWARRVLAAFAANPEAGAVGLEGKMLDIPHLKQAERVIASYEQANSG